MPHNSQLNITSGPLVSMGEAAKNTPYSQEYMSLLARKGKLKAVKIGRDWLTTQAAVREYIDGQRVRHEKMLKALTADTQMGRR